MEGVNPGFYGTLLQCVYSLLIRILRDNVQCLLQKIQKINFVLYVDFEKAILISSCLT